MRNSLLILMVLFLLVPSTADAADGISGPTFAPSRTDDHYIHDDGHAEFSIGTGGSSADICWLQYFDPVGGVERITHISATFGIDWSPGHIPPGTYAHVYLWDDPNNDGDPSDAVLLGQGGGYVRNPDTNIFTHYPLDEGGVTVYSRFFVGVILTYDSL